VVGIFTNLFILIFFTIASLFEKSWYFYQLFGKLLGAPVSILFQFNAISFGCYPSSLSPKAQTRPLKTQPSKILLTAEQGWGLLLFGFSSFKIKSKKKNIPYLLLVFVYIFYV
jgi:hypothetical protein